MKNNIFQIETKKVPIVHIKQNTLKIISLYKDTGCLSDCTDMDSVTVHRPWEGLGFLLLGVCHTPQRNGP